MKRKSILYFATFTLAILLALVGCKKAEKPGNEEYVDLEYSLNTAGDGYIVTGYSDDQIIETITIPKVYNDLPVVEIGEFAFENCETIRTVVIPGSIKKIGGGAFTGCRNLISVTIQQGVEEMGIGLFQSCSALRNVVIPESITTISPSAFNECISLLSIIIPKSITSIESGAFFDCYKLIEIYNLSTLNITKGSEDNGNIGLYAFDVYTSLNSKSKIIQQDNGCVFYNGEESYLMSYIGNETELHLPSSINGSSYKIYQGAFYSCSSLVDVETGDGVIEIGKDAFFNCQNIRNIIIGNNVTTIGKGAFTTCDSLISVTLGSKVSEIESGAFFNSLLVEICNLSELTITKGNQDNGSIGYYALNIYTDSEGESKLINYNNDYIFYSDDQINYLLLYIGDAKELVLPESINGNDYEIFEYAFSGSDITSVNIGNGVTTIGDDAFLSCDYLQSVVIGDKVTIIGRGAFHACPSLKTLTLGENVTTINESAFKMCSSLTSVVIPDSVQEINQAAFSFCYSLYSLKIGSDVTIIEERAFEYCYKLVEVYNFSKLTITRNSEENGFVGFYALNIHTDSNDPSRVIRENEYVYYHDLTTEKYYLLGYEGEETDLVLPASLNGSDYVIYQYAFYSSSLTSVVIPDSVTEIGEEAFFSCESLTNFTIGKGVTSIGYYAFSHCMNLEEIDIPNNVKTIDAYAFSFCLKVSSINLGAVETIGDNAFAGCNLVTEIIIPTSVTTMGEKVFFLILNLNIYCEAESQPANWSGNWNHGGSNVVWGYDGE